MGLLGKSQNKLRKKAKNLHALASKVVNYRRDLLSEAAIADIRSQQTALAALILDKSASSKALEEGMEKLDATLKPHGGSIYPVTFWSENIEMILVAAILAIGVRSFFLQPFKIPTNSMYPTYSGMIEQVYPDGEGSPSKPEQLFRFLTLGASHYQVDAPATGTVQVELFQRSNNNPLAKMGLVAFELEEAQKFLIFPSKNRKYTFAIDGKSFSVSVPLDFNLDDIVAKLLFPGYESMRDVYVALPQSVRIQMQQQPVVIDTKQRFEQGSPVMDFDILTGDMLFVDRFSYNFFQPEVGDPFVFRTDKIEGLRNQSGSWDEKYYIKRLVGLPGDQLELKPPFLYRNGAPIEGADAFEKNFAQEGLYDGYVYRGWMQEGIVETIPPGYFFAMGDNSDESYDSREWAYDADSSNVYEASHDAKLLNDVPVNMVPEKEVVGKAVLIFYPFSSRWGLAE